MSFSVNTRRESLSFANSFIYLWQCVLFRLTRSMLWYCWIPVSIKLFLTSFRQVVVGLPCGFLTGCIILVYCLLLLGLDLTGRGVVI